MKAAHLISKIIKRSQLTVGNMEKSDVVSILFIWTSQQWAVCSGQTSLEPILIWHKPKEVTDWQTARPHWQSAFHLLQSAARSSLAVGLHVMLFQWIKTKSRIQWYMGSYQWEYEAIQSALLRWKWKLRTLESIMTSTDLMQVCSYILNALFQSNRCIQELCSWTHTVTNQQPQVSNPTHIKTCVVQKCPRITWASF